MDFGTLSDPTTHPDDDDDFSEINDSIDTLNFQEKLRNWTKRIRPEAGRQASGEIGLIINRVVESLSVAVLDGRNWGSEYLNQGKELSTARAAACDSSDDLP